MNKGKFPEECPNCHKSDNLEFGDFDFNSDTNKLSQKISCNGCETDFKEFYKPVGWEKVN